MSAAGAQAVRTVRRARLRHCLIFFQNLRLWKVFDYMAEEIRISKTLRATMQLELRVLIS